MVLELDYDEVLVLSGRKNIHTRYKTFLSLVCVLMFILPGSGCVNPKLQDEYIKADLSQDMQAVFDEYRQSIPEMMAKQKIPGLSIAVVDRESILWTAGFGYTDYDRKRPITTDTIFGIMSITKAITATAFMCAVQDGLVELDAPITKYLPDFTVNSRLEDNPQNKITLRHLLTHSAGLIHEAPIGNNTDAQCDSFEQHVKSISDTWLKHRIGAKYSYSNLGFDLAAYILQVRSSRPFAEYLKEKLFDPLDMPNTCSDMERIRNHPNRAIGHIALVREAALIPMTGAGGVYSSANDFANFIQFFLNWGKLDGHVVLDENLVRTMYIASPLSTLDKRQGLGIGCANDDHYRIDEDANYLCGGFWGGGFGFLAFTGWSHEYGIGSVVFTNSVSYGDKNETLALDIICRLISEKLAKKNASHQPWLKDFSNDCKGSSWGTKDIDPFTPTPYKSYWKKYVGTYRYILSGWKFDALGNIAAALGNWGPPNTKVSEKNGYLEIDGERLDEHLPGLFFTKEGECLDFHGPTPIFNGLRMNKIK